MVWGITRSPNSNCSIISTGLFVLAYNRGYYYSEIIETKGRKESTIYAAKRYGGTLCYVQGSTDGTSWTDLSIGQSYLMSKTILNVSSFKYLRAKIYYGHDDHPSDGYGFVVIAV